MAGILQRSISNAVTRSNNTESQQSDERVSDCNQKNEYFKKIAQLLLQRIQNMLPGRITENTESRPQKFEGI